MSDGIKVHFYLPADLLDEFDKRWEKARKDSRSSAIRDLIIKYVLDCQRADAIDKERAEVGGCGEI